MVDYKKLLQNFLSESETILDTTEDTILSLEKGFQSSAIDSIFRSIHTIKGNSGLFDLPRIRELAHVMETQLNDMRSETVDSLPDGIIDLYLLTIDRLRKMIHDISNSNSVDISDLTSQYAKYKVTGTFSSGSSSQGETSPKPENVPNIDTRFQNVHLQIDEAFLEMAKTQKSYLSAVWVKSSSLGCETLEDLDIWLDKNQSVGVLKASTIPEMFPIDFSKSTDSFDWTFFLFLISTQTPKEKVAELGIHPIFTQILFDPQLGSSPSLPAVGTEANKNIALAGGQSTPPSNAPNSLNASVSKDTHLKVSLRLIDDLINLAGEAVIARNELIQKIEDRNDPSLSVSAKKISYLFSKLQEGIMKTRLQELDTVFQRIPRIVRDLARQTNKEVELVMDGGEVELDKTLIDAINDPLVHMVRNSLDHGIESAEDRIKVGKPPKGTVKISGSLRGGNVIIKLIDDGRGIDANRIRIKAVEKGLYTREEAEMMSQEEVLNTIFMPGFSTAEKVTQVSGRGVGMDVVRTNLLKVGGSAEVSTVLGTSTTVTLTIPQTLSIVTCLLVKTAGRRYAIPEQNIQELIRVDNKFLSKVESHRMYTLRDRLIPVVDLSEFLHHKSEKTSTYMVVLKSEHHHFGLLVEEIINPEEIVVKSLGRYFSGLSMFSGATIMGDGESVLILDVPGIAKFWSMQSSGDVDLRSQSQSNKSMEDKNKLLEKVEEGHLIFSVHTQAFAVPVTTIPRIERISAKDIRSFMDFEVFFYRDIAVPVVRLEELYAFEKRILSDTYYVIIFQRNGYRTGFLATEVESVVTDLPSLQTDTFRGDSILGYANVLGQNTLFLDIEDLMQRLRDHKFHTLEGSIMTPQPLPEGEEHDNR